MKGRRFEKEISHTRHKRRIILLCFLCNKTIDFCFFDKIYEPRNTRTKPRTLSVSLAAFSRISRLVFRLRLGRAVPFVANFFLESLTVVVVLLAAPRTATVWMPQRASFGALDFSLG
jgi:hypothetical protein